MRMKYAVSEKTFTKLATDRRWHAMNPADAVGLLKREYTKRSTVAKRQWIVQPAPELSEEYKKLLRQAGREGVTSWGCCRYCTWATPFLVQQSVPWWKSVPEGRHLRKRLWYLL